MRLHISKEQTKTRKRDLNFEILKEVADIIRWYRRAILPLLGVDPNGDLFVTERGRPKHQETLAYQFEMLLADYVGIDMTIHQSRHFVASMYLEEHPESLLDVTDLLGHAWAKTTKIYVGDDTERASRAYNRFLAEQRKALKLRRQRARKRRR